MSVMIFFACGFCWPLLATYLTRPDLLAIYPHTWVYRANHKSGLIVGLVLALGINLLR